MYFFPALCSQKHYSMFFT